MGRIIQAVQDDLASQSVRNPGWASCVRQFFRPVNGASLGLFRIAVGFVFLLEALTLFRPSQSSGGLAPMQVYYSGSQVQFNLPYPGFDWLPLLPPTGMTAVGWILGVASLFLMIGLWHRVSASVVFLAWGYLYAVESTRTYWMSYYYLELLLFFLLIWMPAAQRFGIDGWRSGKPARERTVPAVCVAILRGQLIITYFFAGVAKLNPDWLLDFMPVRWFLAKPYVAERLQGLLGENLAGTLQPWLLGTSSAAFLSWAGAAFDLGVGFLLLARRTRLLGLVLLFTFHGINHFLLFNDIEWFPLVGIATSLIFLASDWPDQLVAWLKQPRWQKPDPAWLVGGALLIPGFGAALGWKAGPERPISGVADTSPGRGQQLATVLALGWIATQVFLPLRHHLFPGDARITFEGLSFSWRLKAEVYRSMPAMITIDDPAVIRASQPGEVEVNWSNWPGEPVIHREVHPGRVPWADLPPLVVVSDDNLGDRILFNPRADGLSITNEAVARLTATRLWTELHGHPPAALHRSTSLAGIIEAFARAAESQGMKMPDRGRAAAYLFQQHGRQGDGRMIPFLRRTQPFAVSTYDDSPDPFLWIEDPQVLPVVHPKVPRIVRTAWKTGSATSGKADSTRIDIGGSPLVLHVIDEEAHLAGQARPFHLWQPAGSETNPAPTPLIRWNLVRDAGISKAMHIGVQPFLLRRYARRVADLWKYEYGRWPAIHALTAVSLNGRPPQPVVDPLVDLAAAPVRLFRHESWIRDLASERIPAPSLQLGNDIPNTAPASP